MRDPGSRALDKVRNHLLPTVQAVESMAFQDQLELNQWLPRAGVLAHQLRQLQQLARFAAQTASRYRSLDLTAIAAASTLDEALAAIPILPRAALANEAATLKANRLPGGHFPTGMKKSSGTSGQLVEAETTNMVYRWQNALNLRAQLWAQRDFTQPIAVIRNDHRNPAPYPEGNHFPQWGAAEVFPFETGPSLYLGTASSLEQQWDWLSRKQPAYLLTYPSIVRAFAARAAKDGHGPCELTGISTVGETVDGELRNDAERYLGADIHDVYSAEEIGVMAIQCPTCRRYHVPDETVVLEILDDNNHPCTPGVVGRVVVTPLMNYATVLLRYDIGDLAEAGASCSCGRGFKTVNRIVGRIRNVFKLADGRTFWPSFGTRSKSFAKVRQHQFRQLDYEQLQVVLALDAPFTDDEEAAARAAISKRLPVPMQISFRYLDEIQREPSGKFQEFICLVQ